MSMDDHYIPQSGPSSFPIQEHFEVVFIFNFTPNVCTWILHQAIAQKSAHNK